MGHPEKEHGQRDARTRNQAPDRIRIVLRRRRLVANAGLLLPAGPWRGTLGPARLNSSSQGLDLGDAGSIRGGRTPATRPVMTVWWHDLLTWPAGDCIDDADVLRTGGTACTLGGTLKAPSTLGTFLRSFRWGHVRHSWTG